MSRRESPSKPKATFEETYVGYPFPELVRLAIAVGSFVARIRSRSNANRHDISDWHDLTATEADNRHVHV